MAGEKQARFRFERLMRYSGTKQALKRLGLLVRRDLLFIAALLLPAYDIFAASNPESQVSEYEVKAAYIYYFAKFTEWPSEVLPNSNSPIIIGIIGNSEFASTLENIVKGKTVQNHPILIHNLKIPAIFSGCHIIFISSYEQQHVNQIIGSLRSASILTVTEAEKSSRSKGLINLLVEEGKVHFEIDLASTTKAGLKISSKLLRLANAFAE
jgi:hypothetical protein